MRQWQLQAAKARLSEVVRASEESGPQEITLRGRAVAVVVAKPEFDRLTARPGSLREFMRRSPVAEMDPGAAPKRARPRRVRR
jgi:prevent-host-death family protein